MTDRAAWLEEESPNDFGILALDDDLDEEDEDWDDDDWDDDDDDEEEDEDEDEWDDDDEEDDAWEALFGGDEDEPRRSRPAWD
ncbi:MAG: hypothetical protein EA350_01040 [Gemmatimonadales bacterium]|nr:MAG: hypothetical protein EA350_01040 [Gemmatimonadales bacterium]